MSTWDRLEGRGRTEDLRGGIEARIADPLWMLARQWQVGEFIGDDAADPVAFHIDYETSPLDTYRETVRGEGRPLADRPLEYDVEAAPPPRHGGARLSAIVSLGHRLRRMLEREGHVDVAAGIAEAFPVPAGILDDVVQLGERGQAVADLVAARAFDVYALAIAPPAILRRGVEDLGSEDPDGAIGVIQQWQRLALARYPVSLTDAWKPETMDHTFFVSAPSATDTPVTLASRGFEGGHLDWFSFDAVSGSHHDLVAEDEVQTFSTIPTELAFAGKPASRWWEFEEGAVQFGDIAAGPTDLARMLVADFATVYSDDWFLVPLVLPVGSLSRVKEVRVVDSFGGRVRVTSAAAADKRPPLGRSWSMFELHGDTSVKHGKNPLLLLPPAVVASQHGPVLERVELIRDEGANLAWAIERLVEGPLGRAVDRRDSWRAATPPNSEPEHRAPQNPEEYRDAMWAYDIEKPAPPYWIPLMPERIRDDAPDIRFRRGQVASWEALEPRLVGPKGELLTPHAPLWIREEEVPRGGVTLERRWQMTRWHDGSVHLWLQRRKQPGRGERSSSLAWDSLTTILP